MIATSTRRKTFATPLEFWQWAIQFPGKRKARGREGEIWSVSLADRGFPVSSRHISGDQLASYILDARLQPRDCPLTAVEDEHGVIEDIPLQDYITEIEAAIDIVRCMDVTCNKETREAYINTSTGLLINAMRQIADERIAAATVETHCLPTRDALFSIPGTEPAWIPRNNLRLKPKGESK